MTKRKPPRPRHPRKPAASCVKRADSGRRRGSRRDLEPADLWLYGVHAVFEALANPRRRVRRLLVTVETAAKQAGRLEPLLAGRRDGLRPEAVPRESLAELLPDGAVHQGLALQAEPLLQPDLPELLERLPPPGPGEASQVVVALDRITDPQNVGAILRSAAAFGAAAVVTTQRHAAPESGALAKAASGALEHLAYLQEVNLARALDELRTAGFRVLGLAAEGVTPIAEAEPGERVVVALGAEGTGLRRLTRERCDLLVRLPTRGPIGQLNVSNAAAVALYELLGRRS
jgi:23S rRNA (guanosine2251-2'-O)-methyltransferase